MLSVPVIHEDDRLLAVNKPAGALVIPGRGTDEEESLLEKLSRESARKLFVVHRLDRDASGLLVFAKDAETHRAFSIAFERREAKKTYLALVRGILEKPGFVDKPIHQFGSGRMGVDPRGKPSVTRYKVKERFRDATLLEVEPESGRRHQIRVHLYSLGHPIAGDRLYGPGQKNVPSEEGRLMLHALRLTLPNPGGGTLELIAEPDADFVSLLSARR